MRVVVFGASGMFGQGVLRECVLDSGVESVLAVVRSPLGKSHPKLRELVHDDFADFSGVSERLSGFDACFWCLGPSSVGMSEADYTRVTHDFTLAAAKAFLGANPDAAFLFISGAGTDPHGKAMWQRVKGRTESELLELSENAYALRPMVVVPLHGIRARTRWTRWGYIALAPVWAVARRLSPRWISDTERLGRAMLSIARRGHPKRILEQRDLTDPTLTARR